MRTLVVDGSDVAAMAAQAVRDGGQFSFRVHGTSMTPAIGDNDTVTVAGCRPETLDPGEIVLYITAHGRAAVHRVVDSIGTTEARSILVRGDNAWDSEIIRTDQVVARVVSIRRGSAVRGLLRTLRAVWSRQSYVRTRGGPR